MKLSRPVHAVLGAAASGVSLTLALGVHAQAASTATTGWRVVFTHHYGPLTNFSEYTAVAAPGRNDAWVFGGTDVAAFPAVPGTPVAVHWNGTRWRIRSLPSGLKGDIAAASAPSVKDVWAVTEIGGDILHWNGTQWSVAKHVSSPTGNLFTGVTALSARDVWVFGFSGIGGGLGTWHLNGHTWTQVTGTASRIAAASAVSASDIWAVGSTPSGIDDAIMRFNGTTWNQIRARALSGLAFGGILARSRTDIWATATADTPGFPGLVVHHTTSGWTRIKLPWRMMVPGALAPDGRGGIWLAAQGFTRGSWAVHLSASGRWSRTAFSPGVLFQLARIPGTTSLWATGWVKKTTGTNAAIWAHGPIR